MGGLLLASDSERGGLGAGAPSNSVCVRWLENHNRITNRKGYQEVSTYPSSARFRFGDGRLGDVRRAADIPVGVAGGEGASTAFVLDVDIPAS